MDPLRPGRLGRVFSGLWFEKNIAFFFCPLEQKKEKFKLPIDSPVIFIYFSTSACHPKPISPQKQNL
jgi:hypothetical protein